MIELVISGGQTGADQAGLRAAKSCGIPTGGWMPKGFKTEDGPRPEFAELYGMKEHSSPEYPPRNVENAKKSEVCLYFTEYGWSPGMSSTLKAINKIQKSGRIVAFHTIDQRGPSESELASKLRRDFVRRLWIAGNRESKSPGIGAWVESYLSKLFRILKEI